MHGCPQYVSYMVANRKAVKSRLRRLYRRCRVREVEHYGELLLATLRELAPAGRPDPCIALLTPGVWNAAFYEHEARQVARGLAHLVHEPWSTEAGPEEQVDRMRHADTECRRLHDVVMAAHVGYDPERAPAG